MQWVLYKLKKELANERRWLSCTVHDAKSAAGKKMAQERVPQLEQAIEILTTRSKTQDTSSKTKTTSPKVVKPKPKNQLSLYELLNS